MGEPQPVESGHPLGPLDERWFQGGALEQEGGQQLSRGAPLERQTQRVQPRAGGATDHALQQLVGASEQSSTLVQLGPQPAGQQSILAEDLGGGGSKGVLRDCFEGLMKISSKEDNLVYEIIQASLSSGQNSTTKESEQAPGVNSSGTAEQRLSLALKDDELSSLIELFEREDKERNFSKLLASSRWELNYSKLAQQFPIYSETMDLEALNKNWQFLIVIVYTFTAIASFLLNSVTVFVLLRGKRSELGRYLISLSVSDLLLSLLSIRKSFPMFPPLILNPFYDHALMLELAFATPFDCIPFLPNSSRFFGRHFVSPPSLQSDIGSSRERVQLDRWTK